MEDGAVRDGFAHLKDGREYGNLCEAAVCRAKADWLIGMNATRAFTTKYYKRLVIGRVQTPTLAMLVERQEKIDTFVKRNLFTKLRLQEMDLLRYLKILRKRQKQGDWQRAVREKRR